MQRIGNHEKKTTLLRPDNQRVTDNRHVVMMEAPFHINWNFSYRCNFDCRHCYSRGRTNQSVLDLQQKLGVAQNIVDSRVFSVNLGGGEPLLDPNLLDVIAYLASNQIIVSLSTNGWNIAKARVQQLKVAGLSQAIISVDSINPDIHDALRQQPGSFAAVLQATELFTQFGIGVVLSTVITTSNFPELEAIVNLAQHHGCKAVEFKRLRLFGNAGNHPDLALSQQQESSLNAKIGRIKDSSDLSVSMVYSETPVEGIDDGCPCGKTALCILADGGIAPCVYNPRVIGNALTDSIADVWQHSAVLVAHRENGICMGLEGNSEQI